MSVQIAGEGGSGATVVYGLTAGEAIQLETLHFEVATDATAGVHSVRLVLTMPTVGVIARLDDLNQAGPSQTNFYTYGLGLNASACTLPTGLAVTDALPWTDLEAGSTIEIIPIDAAGAVIAGDTISNVLMQASRSLVTPPAAKLLPLTLLPGSAEAVAA